MSAAALRILAMDNEPSVTFSLRYIFTPPRYQLTPVENGDAALARLDSGSEHYERMDVHVMFPKPFDVEALRSAVERLAA